MMHGTETDAPQVVRMNPVDIYRAIENGVKDGEVSLKTGFFVKDNERYLVEELNIFGTPYTSIVDGSNIPHTAEELGMIQENVKLDSDETGYLLQTVKERTVDILRDAYRSYAEQAKKERVKPLKPIDFFGGEHASTDFETIKYLFNDVQGMEGNFVEKDFNRYMAGASGFRKKAMAVGFGALLLAMGIGGAAAVAPPMCPGTCIHDELDPMNNGLPTSGAIYTNTDTGVDVNITVDGYGNQDPPARFLLSVYNVQKDDYGKDQLVYVWSDEYIGFGGQSETIPAKIGADISGRCILFMNADSGLWDVDEFYVAEPEKPIPEFPSIGLVTMGLLMVYGLHNHYKRKGQL